MPTKRPRDPAPDPDCAHFWKVAPPNGAYSRARCRKCGGVQLMANSLEAVDEDVVFNNRTRAAQQRGNEQAAAANRSKGAARRDARGIFGFGSRGA